MVHNISAPEMEGYFYAVEFICRFGKEHISFICADGLGEPNVNEIMHAALEVVCLEFTEMANSS